MGAQVIRLQPRDEFDVFVECERAAERLISARRWYTHAGLDTLDLEREVADGARVSRRGRLALARRLSHQAGEWRHCAELRAAALRDFKRLVAELGPDPILGERARYALNDPYIDREAKLDRREP